MKNAHGPNPAQLQPRPKVFSNGPLHRVPQGHFQSRRMDRRFSTYRRYCRGAPNRKLRLDEIAVQEREERSSEGSTRVFQEERDFDPGASSERRRRVRRVASVYRTQRLGREEAVHAQVNR